MPCHRRTVRNDDYALPHASWIQMEEKAHVFAVTKLHVEDLVSTAQRPSLKYLLCPGQMVPAMHMVTTSRFRYSAPLVPWRDAELDKLHAVWLHWQVERVAAWRLPSGYASAPLLLPSRCGGCPVEHPSDRHEHAFGVTDS